MGPPQDIMEIVGLTADQLRHIRTCLQNLPRHQTDLAR